MTAGRAPLVLVDDQSVVAESLATALRLEGFDPVQVVTGGQIDEAGVIAAAEHAGADAIVLLDLHLGNGRRSTALIAPLRDRGHRVLVLTAERDPKLLGECIHAGADGVFDKSELYSNLIALVKDAALGYSVMTRSAKEELVARYHEGRADAEKQREMFDRLTAREGDVLRALVDGTNVVDIAAAEGIAPSTVRTHVKALLRKLGVNSQLGAVALAQSAGWTRDAAHSD